MADLRSGPASPPSDELRSAEATLAVLQQAVHGIAADDLSKPTPCSDYDVAALTDHLLRSLTALGGAAGAQISDPGPDEAVDRRIIAAARPAVDAWHRRGLDGSITIGGNELPARMVAGILSVEFLIHAWDYATAVGRPLDVPDSLADYVLDVMRRTLTPEARRQAGFDDPVEVADDAPALHKLLAFSGRRPN
ncbi:maleylpyruvate isomerase family mycothiol-dependent enzyme [Mycobacterium sp. MYCO198283]|uniref:TIGR03086 family metal-binding protein n=1 Tax=Mycobacterium sp. MYCO198283 TaxID=2883505 RepID=UPI001E2D3164|nr:TIGR03086 family metal-binding protein [Mycobacterium sp. MYCO198283]MCG5432941.1 maleylpyruvate isomerase family mycothiol-dependent enzyme [Mycobacterium sp. MYCO198283]